MHTAMGIPAMEATMGESTSIDPPRETCFMAKFTDESARNDLLNRLKRAEGQLRGIQRMIEQGEPCIDIASQMAAVRKALDSAYVRMTVCFMQQELQHRLSPDSKHESELAAVLEDVQTLLGKVR
jgi:CsoR family transcriptional regulator, copper-sensing transcriptional repressor